MKKELTDLDIIQKWNTKINNKIKVIEYKYSRMLTNRKEKLDQKKKRELERSVNKMKRLMDIEIHNLTHKRQRKTPTDKTVGKVKAKALAEIQKYAKLKRTIKSGEGLIVYILDLRTWVKLDKNVNGGHCYPQKNYSQLAFDIRNIRPISNWGNRKQLDTVGERKKELSYEDQEYLEAKANNKKSKNEIRDRSFYEGVIEKYKALNLIECERLGIKYK